MDGGKKIAGSTRIPVGEMARDNIRSIYPQLTQEQADALNAGLPVPPSPDFVFPEGPKLQADLPVVGDNVYGTAYKRGERHPDDMVLIAELKGKLVATMDALREKARRELVFEAMLRPNNNHLPLVTAVLVFSDKNRLRRARKAVNQFFAQTYPNKQIIVVNASDTPVTTHTHRDVKEVKWEGSINPTTGEMRNLGITEADGDLLIPAWDDDDVYDRDLVAFMVHYFTPGTATALTAQLRVNINTSVAYMHVETDGIPNTVMVPKSDARFEDRTGGEVEAFVNRYWARKLQAVDTRAYPLNMLKMCVYDGNNVASVDQFMVDHTDAALNGKWEIGGNEAEHMRAVLGTFGLIAQPQSQDAKRPQPA